MNKHCFTASLNVAVRRCERWHFLLNFFHLESWKLPGGHRGFKKGFEDTFQMSLRAKDTFKTSFKLCVPAGFIKDTPPQ